MGTDTPAERVCEGNLWQYIRGACNGRIDLNLAPRSEYFKEL
jgi:hypothetical protein